MKHASYAYFLLIFLLLGGQLSAQKTATSPATLGIDVGFVLSYQQPSNASLQLPTSSQQIQFRYSYRLVKWFGLSAAISYSKINVSDDTFIQEPTASRVGEPWGWFNRSHRIPFVVGPEFNFRLGQGDLSVAAQLGMIYHQTKVDLHNATTPITLQFTPTLNYYNNLSLSYTYWPKKQFGIRVGVQFQDLLTGSYSTAKLTSSSQQAYPELESEIVNWVRPRTLPYQFNFFQIGLTYRI